MQSTTRRSPLFPSCSIYLNQLTNSIYFTHGFFQYVRHGDLNTYIRDDNIYSALNYIRSYIHYVQVHMYVIRRLTASRGKLKRKLNLPSTYYLLMIDVCYILRFEIDITMVLFISVIFFISLKYPYFTNHKRKSGLFWHWSYTVRIKSQTTHISYRMKCSGHTLERDIYVTGVLGLAVAYYG